MTLRSVSRVIARASFFLFIGAFPVAVAAEEGQLNAQLFSPIEDDGKFVWSSDSTVIKPWEYRTGFFLNYAHEPLVSVDSLTGERTPVLKSLWTGDFQFAVGLHDVIQAALAVPVNYASGEASETIKAFSSADMGDARLRAKVQILDPQTFPVGLAVVPTLSIPTGNQAHFVGNDGVTGGAFVVTDARFPGITDDPLTVGAGVGMTGRKEIPTGKEALGSELNYNVSVNVPVLPKFDAILDMQGRTLASSPFKDVGVSPIELVGAVRSLALKESLGTTITFGIGRGLNKGIGSPVFRAFAGIQYAFGGIPPDIDNDTYLNSADACPEAPEDFDSYKDQDGCPEPAATMRGKVAALHSGYALGGQVSAEPAQVRKTFANGYFELVTEATGPQTLTVSSQGYRNEYREVALFPGQVTDMSFALYPLPMRVTLKVIDEEGNLVRGTLRNETDGVEQEFTGAVEMEIDPMRGPQQLQIVSKGFLPAERRMVPVPGAVTTETVVMAAAFRERTFEGKVVDGSSGAPLPASAWVAALKQRVAAHPDTGLFSFSVTMPGSYAADVTANGYDPKTVVFETAQPVTVTEVRLAKKQIKVVASKLVLDPIFFANNKADILPNSFPILDSVADYLKSNPDIRLRIEGHTDNKGSDKKNLELSEKRVKSVVSYLTEKGIEPNRMKAKGFGETKPIAPNDTEGGREMNRRVEFIIDNP